KGGKETYITVDGNWSCTLLGVQNRIMVCDDRRCDRPSIYGAISFWLLVFHLAYFSVRCRRAGWDNFFRLRAVPFLAWGRLIIVQYNSFPSALFYRRDHKMK